MNNSHLCHALVSEHGGFTAYPRLISTEKIRSPNSLKHFVDSIWNDNKSHCTYEILPIAICNIGTYIKLVLSCAIFYFSKISVKDWLENYT